MNKASRGSQAPLVMDEISSKSSNFTYKPLGNGEVRLLTLHPGVGRMPIECNISHVLLSEMPSYEALSYAWGVPGNERSIFLEGEEVKIRENLWDALFHLRRQENSLRDLAAAFGIQVKSRQRIIWIDALCINQTDIQERNHQVVMMQRIYSQAETVVAWLGLSESGSSMVFGCIKEHGNWFQSEREHSESLSEITVQQAVIILLGKEYWQRLWIIQEFCLARELILVCGWDQVNWDKFKDWNWPDWHSNFAAGEAHFTNLLSLRSSHWRARHRDLAEVLRISKRSLCTDPRDRIYGILGLLSDSPGSLLSIDYTKSLLEVYQDAIFYRLKSSGKENICFANFSTELQLALGLQAGSQATRAGNGEFGAGAAELIPILAKSMGFIKYLGPVYDPHRLRHREDETFWTEVRRSAGGRSRRRDDDALKIRYYALRADEFRKVIPFSAPQENRPIKEPGFPLDLETIASLLKQQSYHEITISRSASSDVPEFQLRYILTDEGYIGLAPMNAEERHLLLSYDSPLSAMFRSTFTCIVDSSENAMKLVGRSMVFPKSQDRLSITPTLPPTLPIKLDVDIETLQLLTF